MLYWKPELALGVLLPEQTETVDKWGGLPWGLPVERWPRCASCGKPLSHLATLTHDSERLDLKGGGRILMVFQCNHDPGGCDTWAAGSGANAVLILEPGDIGSGLTHPPDAPNIGEATKVEPEARVLHWIVSDDGLTPEQAEACYNEDTFNALPGNVLEGLGTDYAATKLGGPPFWVQFPEIPGPNVRFVGQFGMYHTFSGPAPRPEQIGCRVQRETTPGHYQIEKPLPNAPLVYSGIPFLTENIVPQGREYLCQAADYGDAGTAYLFLSSPATPGELPTGKFLWQCG